MKIYKLYHYSTSKECYFGYKPTNKDVVKFLKSIDADEEEITDPNPIANLELTTVKVKMK
jgi:hypothetical protein